MSEAITIPTWGYRSDGSAEIFELQPGEGLPDGWHPSPDIITDPTAATAEALSATAARAAETPRRPVVQPMPFAADADALATLQAANRWLAAEVVELRQDLANCRAAYEEALAHIKTLATQLTEALASQKAGL